MKRRVQCFLVGGLLALAGCGSPPERDAVVPADTTAAALRAQLLEMGRADQAVRESLTLASSGDTLVLARIARVDSGNTARLRELVDTHGWPKRSRVGDEAAQAAFLVVQHSPSPEFRRDMLELLREAADRGEAELSDVAMLTDRVLVNDGRPQLYGTQFHIEDGRLVPYPIADIEGVDAARAAMGLMPMDEYVEALRDLYDGPVEWSAAADSAAARDSAVARDTTGANGSSPKK